jgi:hypothetical protein
MVTRADLQAGKVFAVYITGDVTLAAACQDTCEVDHPGPNFQHLFLHVWPDSISHPSIESRRHGKGIQYLGARVLIEVAGKSEVKHDPQGLERILEPDLLAFIIISTAAIADRHFIDARVPLGYFIGDSGSILKRSLQV